jgi:hypothetical protein
LKHYSYEYCCLMGGFGGAHVVWDLCSIHEQFHLLLWLVVEYACSIIVHYFESNCACVLQEVQQSWQGLLRSLYERIVMLEQRNREQDIQLENMKRQLFANIDQASQDLALRYCNGTYLWTVTQISNKLVAMAANPTRCMFYSPGFYTAPNGYRYKLCYFDSHWINWLWSLSNKVKLVIVFLHNMPNKKEF